MRTPVFESYLLKNQIQNVLTKRFWAKLCLVRKDDFEKITENRIISALLFTLSMQPDTHFCHAY